MKVKYLQSFIILLCFNYCLAFKEEVKNNFTIACHIPDFAHKTVTVKGYELLSEIPLGTAQANNVGEFTVSIEKPYRGILLFYVNNQKTIMLIADNKNLTVEWGDINNYATFQVSGEENTILNKGMNVYQTSQSKLMGLHYLLPLYKENDEKLIFFKTEITSVNQQLSHFINEIDHKLYAKKYLAWRKVLLDMSLGAPYVADEAEAKKYKNMFTTINFSDKDLRASGLYAEIINSYTQLCKPYNQDQQERFLNPCIRYVAEKITDQEPDVLTKVMNYWFNLLEEKNLLTSASYLANFMLHNNCSLNENELNKFEQYGQMAIGNKAPDISINESKTLSLLDNTYKVVVFGASWCPHCQQDYPELKTFYEVAKDKYDLEILYVSIDADKEAYRNFFRNTPFLTMQAPAGWEAKIVKDYHVFATPTIFVLSKDLDILFKALNVKHLEAWFQHTL